MTGFHEVQFPPDISYGASGGPGYATTVVTTVSGHERRNANWAMARGRWNVAHGLKKREQVAELIAFFRARRGRAYGFRFKDWTDHQALAQSLGVGDGATKTFQLVKHYASGGAIETRVIAKPVAGTVKSTAMASKRFPAGVSMLPPGSLPSASHRPSASRSPRTSPSTCRYASTATRWT
jgi:uncharacterized protein (TIGR02217 family)